jgi:hypothetical protein
MCPVESCGYNLSTLPLRFRCLFTSLMALDPASSFPLALRSHSEKPKYSVYALSDRSLWL